MGLPTTRNRTFIPRVTPIPAGDLNDIQDSIVGTVTNQASSNFGSGSDGDLTIDGVIAAPSGMTKAGTVYTLTRDWFFKTLIVTGAGVIVKENGFRIYCKKKLKTVGGAYIDASGGDANIQVAGAPGVVGTVNGGVGGSDGTNGVGAAGGPAANGYGGNGGNGGTSLSAGGAGGTATIPTATQGNPNAVLGGPLLGAIASRSGFTWFLGGAAGGAGGGGGTTNLGGGPGTGGGVLAIAARKIELESANDLRARGGRGGDVNNASNSGGGGGGGGGCAVIICQDYTVFSGVLNAATVCAGGAPGAGSGVVVASTAGATGNLFLVKVDVDYVGVTTTPTPVPTMLPDAYDDNALPDPATFPVNAVIINRTTKQLLVNLTGAAWDALS